jgi:hypothetical protein
MTYFLKIRKRSGKVTSETFCSILILFALALIGTGILILQGRYDKNFQGATVLQKGAIIPPDAGREKPMDRISGIEPEGVEPMGPAEVFNPDTLSDKIDGKAELYLEYDFIILLCRRFAAGGAADQWFEVFIYDMGEPLNAFGVYTLQRRPGTYNSDLAQYSYTAENALFFMQGKYYVEIVAAQTSDILKRAILEAGKKIISQYPAGAFSLPELSLLPEENEKKETIKYFNKNTFSFEKLDHTVAVIYQLSGKDLTAFISMRKSAEEAENLKKEYYQFLLSLGGKKVETRDLNIPGLAIVNLLGDLEYIFTHGNILAGVHAATDSELAGRLVSRMFERLSQVEK